MTLKFEHGIENEHEMVDIANALSRFVLMYYGYMSNARDYGTGDLVSAIEIHVLSRIHECPGVTVTALAHYWNRTKGAISQTVTKLEKKGFVERRKKEGDAKMVYLYCTEAGESLSRAHDDYDAKHTAMFLERHRDLLTLEDARAFLRVLRVLESAFPEADKS